MRESGLLGLPLGQQLPPGPAGFQMLSLARRAKQQIDRDRILNKLIDLRAPGEVGSGHLAHCREEREAAAHRLEGRTIGHMQLHAAAILAGMLLPALSKAKEKSKAVTCGNNVKQLTLGWQLYADDANDRFVNNHGIGQTEAEHNNWVDSVQSWGAKPDNTNIASSANASRGTLVIDGFP